jgi:TolB protein
MIKYLLFVLLLIDVAFCVDARMDIVKTKAVLPNIFINVHKSLLNQKYTQKIKQLIKKDLEVSGHFKQIDLEISSFASDSDKNKIFLENNIAFVLDVDVITSNNVALSVKFINLKANTSIFEATYSSNNKNKYPFLVHNISIDIAKHLNKPSLEWMNRKVIFSKYTTSGKSQIIISDYTLSYQKVVVDDGLSLFPKWANQEQDSFYYTSYSFFEPTLLRKDIKTNAYTKILSSNGMMVCSDVSSDGRVLLVTMAPNDQADVYKYNLDTKLKTKLTNYGGIDVGGNFIDNDERIIFISDRLDYPNIFAKKIGEQGVEQIVYHGKNNAQVSSFNNYVVYSSRESFNEFGLNIFNLYLISTKSDFIRRLTTTGINQSPKFSRNGEHILFIKRYGDVSYIGLIGLNDNKLFLFRLNIGKIQSMDWQ